jgi:hypothetical protein
VIMFDQSKRLSQPLRWTRAGRLAVIAVGALLTAAVAVVVVIASTSGSHLRPGCIEVTFPSTLGGAVMHACGSQARRTCAAPAESPGLAANGALREACRRAALSYGRSSG